MKRISFLVHPHLIAVKAIIRKGGKCYFMFPWADGRNLREFCRENRRPRLDPVFIKEIFQQLSRLADAIDAMHNLGDSEGSFRLGDLKLENILRFLDGSQVGILKQLYLLAKVFLPASSFFVSSGPKRPALDACLHHTTTLMQSIFTWILAPAFVAIKRAKTLSPQTLRQPLQPNQGR